MWSPASHGWGEGLEGDVRGGAGLRVLLGGLGLRGGEELDLVRGDGVPRTLFAVVFDPFAVAQRAGERDLTALAQVLGAGARERVPDLQVDERRVGVPTAAVRRKAQGWRRFYRSSWCEFRGRG